MHFIFCPSPYDEKSPIAEVKLQGISWSNPKNSEKPNPPAKDFKTPFGFPANGEILLTTTINILGWLSLRLGIPFRGVRQATLPVSSCNKSYVAYRFGIATVFP